MVSAQAIGRRNRKQGERSEDLAARLLQRLGMRCIQRIGTPWTVQRVGRRIVSAFPQGKVAGDFTALMPDGRGVLVECKRRSESLSYGDLEPHQHQHLAQYIEHGGEAFVVWHEPQQGMWCMHYAHMIMMGWRKGHPLRPAMARALDWGNL